jgi:hypothetical protein
MPEILAAAVLVVGLVLIRGYAARQVAKRRGAFVWAFAFPTLLGAAVMVWAGARLLLSGQLIGVASSSRSLADSPSWSGRSSTRATERGQMTFVSPERAR